ncbi:putative serine/threonine-protein phosphatase 7 long form-like protein [Sesbania bispinosa]|nr:putative serine/threonine-protein phosphatase 7 long form-like protein [Sesbania bispinosa]
MVKRRGGSTQGIESSSIGRTAPVEHVRPTASTRQQKSLTHGRKLKRPEDDYIRDIVDDFGLGPLIEGTHSLLDWSLVSALWRDVIERHPVSIFQWGGCSPYLPWVRMRPTVTGQCSKVSHVDAFIETEITRGAYVRLSWLREIYNSNLQQKNLDAAARAYLLHLVASLEYLYEQLKGASCHNTRQLASYSTLLQAWILEHFPHIMHIERSPDYVDDIAIVPYHPFHDVCWYYGYICCGSSLFPHLPDRVLRQEEGTSIGTQNSTSHEGITQRLQALLRQDMITAGSNGERLSQGALSIGAG